jgi:hypothetical protein
MGLTVWSLLIRQQGPAGILPRDRKLQGPQNRSRRWGKEQISAYVKKQTSTAELPNSSA